MYLFNFKIIYFVLNCCWSLFSLQIYGIFDIKSKTDLIVVHFNVLMLQKYKIIFLFSARVRKTFLLLFLAFSESKKCFSFVDLNVTVRSRKMSLKARRYIEMGFRYVNRFFYWFLMFQLYLYKHKELKIIFLILK